MARIKKLLEKERGTTWVLRQHVRILCEWINAKNQNHLIQNYFHDENIKSIAIYGMSHLGITLLYELMGTDINILYAIDRNPNLDVPIKVYSPDDELPVVDAIVVTAFTFFDDIETNLKRKVNYRIISLEDIVEEC